MTSQTDPDEVARALLVGVGLLVRRVRQSSTADGDDLTLPEASALARLDRGGSATAAALAKIEQISPQSMGATLGALEERGLVERAPDPSDGRRVVVTLSAAGLERLRKRRNARSDLLARSLSTEFTAAERRKLMDAAPLLERLAQNI